MAGTVHPAENPLLVQQAEQEAASAARQLAQAAHLHRGQIVVVGCSTSEVVGHQVGSWSTPEVARAIFRGLNGVFAPMGVYIAAQCCEHLNRALIVEEEAARAHRLEVVNAVPQPKAGGAFATAAYREFSPSRWRWSGCRPRRGWTSATPSSGCTCGRWRCRCAWSLRAIGQANPGLAARTRPRYIGGERAHLRREAEGRLPLL